MLWESLPLIALLCSGRRECSAILLDPAQKKLEQVIVLSDTKRKEFPRSLSKLLELHSRPEHPNPPDAA